MNVVNNNAVNYNDGEIEIDVPIDGETVWLSRKQLSVLFDRDVKTIGKHIVNVFRDGELVREVVVAKFATTTQHGAIKDKTQTNFVEYYNLDMIISVGYRVKSQRGVAFRQWATKVLKQYIVHGYAINSEKITHERFKELEGDVERLKLQVSELSGQFKDPAVTKKQGVFFNGQIFDAYVLMSSLIKEAKKSVVLIDNYIDETTLVHLSHKAPKGVSIRILTKVIGKGLRLDLKKHNEQYATIEVKQLKHAHDRFLLIDEKIYHLGASLKDLGKRWFAFSLIEEDVFELKKKIGEVLDV